MNEKLNKEFWTQRYLDGTTGWDIGYPSTPLKEYIDQLENKEIRILVPGAGNAYEVEYLWALGFINVYVLDFSPIPLKKFKERNPTFPEGQILLMDFFELDKTFDLVLEQTFFCAIDRNLRQAYTNKMSQLIKNRGELAGVLFGVEFEKQGPAFGGSKEEYIKYFEPHFEIIQMDICKNSIPPRAGNELWVELVRK